MSGVDGDVVGCFFNGYGSGEIFNLVAFAVARVHFESRVGNGDSFARFYIVGSVDVVKGRRLLPVLLILRS